MARYSCLALLVLSLSTASEAWVPHNQRPSSPSIAATTTRTTTTAAAVAPARHSLLQMSTMMDRETEQAMTAQSSQQQDAADAAQYDFDPEYAAVLEASKAKLAAGIPPPMQDSMWPLLSHFFDEYMMANQLSGKVEAAAAAKTFMTGVQYGMQYGMGDGKYVFDVSHEALRGRDPEKEDGNTIDFYEFGCGFFRNCMDMETSVVDGLDNLQQAMDQIAAGENVVLFANHQSEADPQVVSCMMENVGLAKQAADLVYIAGHKVTTDALAIPFSMGRNLICIHSKKHINADKESKPVKQRQNLRAMSEMLNKLKRGGTFLWVAPSGGRDRRDVESGDVPIAPFDSKTIDMFRLMGNKSKVPTHYYTLAMVSYDLCPPPDTVEAGTGEQRNVRYVPVGIACSPELENVGGLESRHAFCEHAEAQCRADYDTLLAEIAAKQQPK